MSRGGGYCESTQPSSLCGTLWATFMLKLSVLKSMWFVPMKYNKLQSIYLTTQCQCHDCVHVHTESTTRIVLTSGSDQGACTCTWLLQVLVVVLVRRKQSKPRGIIKNFSAVICPDHASCVFHSVVHFRSFSSSTHASWSNVLFGVRFKKKSSNTSTNIPECFTTSCV